LSSSEKHGIAIDLGTTTIAAALAQLSDGRILARAGTLNPQRANGLDVVSRLEFAGRSAVNLREMQSTVNAALSDLAEKLMSDAGVTAAAVDRTAIAGNPTMSHLLLGLPIDTLARPPYRPRMTGAHSLRSSGLGWKTDFPLYVFPSPGGFVGGDTVAFLYGLGFPDPRTSIPEPALFLDLGTNGEIALLAGGKFHATSAAAGPAFEGGNLSCGMAALPGAIFSVEVHGGRLVTTCIDNAPPKGLCGSGVLDTVALLLKEGLLDETGCLQDPLESLSPLGDRLQEIEGERHFVVYRDAGVLLSLSQGDIRQVQLAKGAVRAALEVLCERAGIDDGMVRTIVLTGSFGASLRFESLKSIGVLTKNMVRHARFLHDGALAGALRFLIDQNAERQVEALSAALKIIPLSGTPLFERQFMKHINFTQG
jgi:uncharacterized 2Fe-2S/4Fe-4S cluster protein (DUF4445 family)